MIEPPDARMAYTTANGKAAGLDIEGSGRGKLQDAVEVAARPLYLT